MSASETATTSGERGPIARVLLDRDGRLRVGLRLLVHTVLVVGLLIPTVALLTGVVLGLAFLGVDVAGDMRIAITAQAVGTMAWMGLATLASAWLLDARWTPRFRLGRLRGIGQGRPILRGILEWILGIVLAGIAMGISVGVMAIGGMDVEISVMSWSGVDALVWVGAFAVFLCAAWFEELLFRGYAFVWVGGALARVGHALVGRTTGWPRMLVDALAFAFPGLLLSVIFGVVHGTNPSASVLSTVNTVLAGVWFVVLVLRTRSLWAAISAHWVWNTLTILVLGLPVSGLGAESGVVLPTLLDLDATGVEWLSGGSYGPEGSIGATLGAIVVIVLSALLPRRRPEQGFAAFRAVGDELA